MNDTQKKKILFITPGANSTGANLFLLRFLQWFKKNTDLPFVTLYGYGGDIEKDFCELSPAYKYIYDSNSDGFLKKGLGKIASHYGITRSRIKTQIQNENIGLIYSNSVTNYPMLSMFENLGVPVISHVHELESVIEFFGIDDFRRTVSLTDHFVAVSSAVQNNLVETHGVSQENCSLVYGFVPVEEFSDERKAECRKAVCAELDLPENAFVVGASGTLNWRKAPDIFIRIASDLQKTDKDLPIYFVWVGGAAEGDYSLYQARYDVNKLGLSKKVFFLEHKSDPSPYFAAIDVFAMVSREDPFPLVCLESAAHGKPVICFDDAGGMPEFVDDSCGFVVPYLDAGAFASKIVELFEKPVLRQELGDNAAARIRDRHDIEKSSPVILSKIREYL